VLALALAAALAQAEQPPEWTPSHRYRARLEVDPRGRKRSGSPASIDLDFPRLFKVLGASGEFDETSLEVTGYDAAGRPRVFDASRLEGERTLLPWRVERYFGTGRVTLRFVVPDATWTRVAVYFDTVSSGLGKPRRYPGLVGDGDRFVEGFKRREINASHFDQFVDFDGDGDLDLFKGGVEPYVTCFENIGRNLLVDRGRLTSAGSLFVLPCSREHRSWVTVAFHDWDGDGDQDFFPSFSDGPDAGRIVFYRNTTRENGGQLTFTRVGPLVTVSGGAVAGGEQAGGWFPSVCFADWDGDGKTDLIVGSNNRCWLYRSTDSQRLADAVALRAGGEEIRLVNPRFDCADIDADGDLDLFAGCQPGPIYWFQNRGSRTQPELAEGVVLAYGGKYLIGDAHSGVKVADFDGDGLQDLVAGRFWERTELGEADRPRDYGGLWKNVGTKTAPKFDRRGANAGAPYTEGFQICDAVRQNGVRAVDWNGDGRSDLLAGDTDGFVWCFFNESDRRFPVFATGVKLRAEGGPLNVVESGGHARFDVCDWNNDGAQDLVVADGDGTVTLFLGRDGGLGAGRRIGVQAGARASVLVCDWDNDGKKDLVLAGGREYLVCRNEGDDANPVLAPARSITFEGQSVRYVRPNLGSFVDWDGDGKKDLIGCHFENSIRFYRNLGRGAAGEEPRFASPEGTVIVRASSPQMISGADAVDWNGDGDLDILTGQGHGASGLRFYERDFLDDEAAGLRPGVTLRGADRR